MFAAVKSNTKISFKKQARLFGCVDWWSADDQTGLIKVGQEWYSFWVDDLTNRASVKKGDMVIFTPRPSKVFKQAALVQVMHQVHVVVPAAMTPDEEMARAEAWIDNRLNMEQERE